MNGKMFIELVIKMRNAQKSWFATHKYQYYQAAIKLEKQVDEIIETYKDNLSLLEPKQLEFNFE